MDDQSGKWIGWGLGDVDPTVLALKQFFLRKFAKTAAPLAASVAAGGAAANTFDQAMHDFVVHMQTAYGDGTQWNPGLSVSGIINYAWKIRCGYLPPPKITILTAQGTGTNMWDQAPPQPYGAAMYVKKMYPGLVNLQPVGNYPAAPVPMGPSIKACVDSSVALLGGAPPMAPGDPVYPTGPIIGWWYSQSAIAGSHLWRDETLNPAGRLHHRLNDWIAVVAQGNPCRCPGKANGNANDTTGVYGGFVPPADHGGICGPDDLKPDEVPDWFYDYVWPGADNGKSAVYENWPVGANPWTAETAQGKVALSFWKIVENPTFGDVLSVALDLGMPLGDAEALFNIISFAAKGPAADHYAYNWLPEILYVQWVVETWTNNYIRSGGAITGPPVLVPAIPGAN